jgi:Tfp pilus assembly protein PilP
MKVGLFVFVLAGGVASMADAQDRLPPGTHVGSTAEPHPSSSPAVVTYDDQGRRDPFVSLLVTKKTNGPSSVKPKAGLAGVALADVAVKGIIHNGKATMAVLEGPGGKSFIARSKDLLQDATIKTIDADGVVFVQHVVDAIGMPHARDVRKSLRQITEADR